MNPDSILRWYMTICAIVTPIGAAIVLYAPVVGRFIAPWKPILAEQLIRLGADVKAARAARKLDPMAPSVSAQPLHEASAAVAASSPSVRPLPRGPNDGADLEPPASPPSSSSGPGAARWLFAALLFLTGCQGLTAASIGKGAVAIAGAACEIADGQKPDDPFVTFLCDVVGDATETVGRPSAEQPTHPQKVKIRVPVQVPRDQVEDFKRKHRVGT